MAKYYDENEGSYEKLRDAKMPTVKDIRCPDSCYYSKQDWNGGMGYLDRQDKIASSDSKKLRSDKEKM